MNKNENNKITLIYCGKEFHYYTRNGNSVHRYFFIDEQFTFFEFYDNGGYKINDILSGCKLGTRINVTWKRYGQTWKKIILEAEKVTEEPDKHPKA